MMPYSRGSINENKLNGSLNNSLDNGSSIDNSMYNKNNRNESLSRLSVLNSNNMSSRKESVSNPISNRKTILLNSQNQSQRNSLTLVLPKISEEEKEKNIQNIKLNKHSRVSSMKNIIINSSSNSNFNFNNECKSENGYSTNRDRKSLKNSSSTNFNSLINSGSGDNSYIGSSNNLFINKKNSASSNNVLDFISNNSNNNTLIQGGGFNTLAEPPRKRVTGISFDKMTKRKDFFKVAVGPSGGDYKPNFDSVRRSLKSKII
jgi:hypothetical protein